MNAQDAKTEARAKTIWGEPQEQVSAFLQQNGFTETEVGELLAEWNQERVDAIRSSGIKKITIGALLIPLPFIAYFVFMAIGYMQKNIFGLTCVAAMFGTWKLIDGLHLILAPRSERGDISNLPE